MFYEVRANLYFSEEDEAKDFYHDCELALAKSGIINPNQPNIEWGIIQLIINNHDQDPNQSCELIALADNKPEH